MDKDNQKLRALAAIDASGICARQQWRHWKGSAYTVIGTGIVEKTMGPVVMYAGADRFRRTTAKTVSKDLRVFADWGDQHAQDLEKRETADWLNDKLDALLGDDVFGTEGQGDPRGDRRD